MIYNHRAMRQSVAKTRAAARTKTADSAPQPPLGVVMLETRFPRFAGDIGNPRGWNFPILRETAKGASARLVVCEPDGDGGARARQAVIRAARALARRGVCGIATSCGLLAPMQSEIAAATGLPCAASPLLQTAAAQATLPPGRRAAILTISTAALRASVRRAAKMPPRCPIAEPPPDGVFARAILEDRPTMDFAAARAEIEQTARALARRPGVGAIVLECSNLEPHADAIARATGLPVFGMGSFLAWFYAALAPRRYRIQK